MVLRWFLGCFVVFATALCEARAEPPLISYHLSNGKDDRRLLFVNNPEMLRADPLACDLADERILLFKGCAKRLFRMDDLSGNLRVWWEHRNMTGRAIDYGVRVTNTSSAPVEVRLQGRGLALDAARFGGREFVERFANPRDEISVLPPGQSFWLSRSKARAIPAGDFFAGVVDFAVESGVVLVETMAFVDEPAVALSGGAFEQRVSAGVHESLVYKGVVNGSVAAADDVDWRLDDATPQGPLPVLYPLFRLSQQATPPQLEAHCAAGRDPLCGGDVGSFDAQPTERTSWVTHIAPDPLDANPKRALAVVSDMVSLQVPGLPASCGFSSLFDPARCFLVSALYKWEHPDFRQWRFPNWGNWAVHYRLSGSLVNEGSRPRVVVFSLTPDGDSPIAYRGGDRLWHQLLLQKSGGEGGTLGYPLMRFELPPQTSRNYVVEFVLSGPAAGTLEQRMVVVE